MLRGVIFSSLVLSVSAYASEATLVVDGGGRLIGATGVNVNGTLYDVSFQDGVCASLFNGCDDPEDFLFTTKDSALAASRALLEQVLIDGPDGPFNSAPERTRGCELDDFSCDVLTPYDATFGGITRCILFRRG